MSIRKNVLWKVPVYCLAASWLSFWITARFGGYFFAVQTVGEDGVINISADPVRSMIFSSVLFLVVLLAGGLWFFRDMTQKEIALSASIHCAVFMLITLAQLLIPDFPLNTSIFLAYFQNWTGELGSLLYRITGNLAVSSLLADFSPLLFIPFGKKAVVADHA